MTEREAILATLRAALPGLRQRWPIHALGVFGSTARDDARPDSDVDILVEFERPVGLSAFLSLEDRLQAIAGRKIDLVSRPALKRHMSRNVMRDLIWL
jgi:uncharacterized protein